MAKSILLTGGTGLLGKGLGDTAPSGSRVLSVHLRDYATPDSKLDQLVLDIRDKKAVQDLFERNQFDLVIHAAGIASVDYVEKNYAESLESNIVGTLNVTSMSRKSGCHLVYVSTDPSRHRRPHPLTP